jgi:Xaa-Pro aminopeptidase
MTMAAAVKLRTETLMKGNGLLFVGVEENLVDKVWGEKQPSRNADAVFIHTLEFAGKTPKDKFNQVAKAINDESKAKNLVIGKLDDIAWILNLRGTDINYNPLFFSYMIFQVGEEDGKHSARLYVN